MDKFPKVPSILAAIAICGSGLAGCTEVQDRALVYGERSGVNIALRSDPAKALPVEVNAGVQRRVTTLVPPQKRNDAGRPIDEAVNMISSFDLKYDNAGGSEGLFAGTTAIASIFTTGAAADALATTIDEGGTPEGLADAIEANRLFVNKN
ncbi:hypothetical protein [uncultured Ruegeria sp.]|uniref:hypothetical protein n=1 Tax=uncultured Ruegeria sp. TaxID=259304 RepID=UPI00262B8A27|nr:hypothetical protein [uncultured Ruegeria sp.]